LTRRDSVLECGCPLPLSLLKLLRYTMRFLVLMPLLQRSPTSAATHKSRSCSATKIWPILCAFNPANAAKYVGSAGNRQAQPASHRRGSHRSLPELPMSGLSRPLQSVVGCDRWRGTYKRSRNCLSLLPLMKFLSFSQHLQNGFHSPGTRLGLFGRLQSPSDGIDIGPVQPFKKRSRLFVFGEGSQKICRDTRSAR
jgi:hypothetical protein